MTMQSAKAGREWWLSDVEAIVAQMVEEKADAKRQEEMWDWMERTFGKGAGGVGKELFDELTRKPEAEPEEGVGGPGCLNRFSASISGASAGVRLPSGVAAG
jgi:hypothetical protein